MAKQIRTHYDFGKISEIRNGVIHLLSTAPSSPAEGQIYHNTVSHRINLYTGAGDGWQALLTANTRLDQIAAPTSAVSMNNQQITNVADGSADGHAATVGQLNTAIRGQTWKDDVRVAHSANVNISNPGTMVYDGVTLVAGERVLLYGQSTASQNGPYVVGASSATALVRAPDFDASSEIANGAAIPIREGTQADSYALLTTDGAITLGSTNLTFTILGGTSISAGAGLTKTGNVFDVVSSHAFIVVNADSIDIGTLPVNKGGTGATDAATARTNLAATTKVNFTIGTGASTSIACAHNLGTRDVQVEVYDMATYDTVECDVVRTDTNTVTLGFASAPATNALRAVVIG